MLIDCDRCVARGPACADCVVSVLLGDVPDSGPQVEHSGGCRYPPGAAGEAATVRVDAASAAALHALADGGLVPPLRLVLPDTGTG